MNAESALRSISAESFAKVAGLILESRIGMFTTVTADGTLHSRPLLTRQVDLADNALWFFAVSNFDKVGVMLDGKEVAISYASADRKGYLSVSGRVQVVHDKAKTAELWTPMASTRFPKNVADPRLILLRVNVEAVEYWDAP